MITKTIDKYSVHIYGNDLRGRVESRAARIYLFSSGSYVGTAIFAREGHTMRESRYYKGIIYYYAQGEQYERVLDLLRNEKPVYLRWTPHSDPDEPNDGNAYFLTNREPIGEEES